MKKLLKPYLRQLILKTHPDYFHNDLLKKQTNAASLQKLDHILQQNNKETVKLHFYVKGHKNLKKTGIFNAKDSPWFKMDSFFQLCKQMEIPVLQSDIDIVQQEITKELNRDRPQYKTLSQEFADKLYQQQQQQQQPIYEPNDIIKNNLIMFDPSIDKVAVAEKLCTWLPDLEPEKWWGKVPLLIISSNTPLPPKQATQGILVIHNNMTLEEIQSYLEKQFNSIQ